MTVFISMLRGVNLGHRRVKMEALRALYKSLKLRDAQTYVQSGNVIFKTQEKDLVRLAKGEHLKLRYGLVLHDGDTVQGGVAEIYPVAGAVKPRKVFRTAAMPSGVTVMPM